MCIAPQATAALGLANDMVCIPTGYSSSLAINARAEAAGIPLSVLTTPPALVAFGTQAILLPCLLTASIVHIFATVFHTLSYFGTHSSLTKTLTALSPYRGWFSGTAAVLAWAAVVLAFAQAAANKQMAKGINVLDCLHSLGETQMRVLWATVGIAALLALLLTVLHFYPRRGDVGIVPAPVPKGAPAGTPAATVRPAKKRVPTGSTSTSKSS
jgi:hypothetical protein